MSNIKIIRETLSKAMFEKVQTFNSSEDKIVKRVMKQTMNFDIRVFSEYIGSSESTAVKLKKEELGISDVTFTWSNQTKYDPGRKVFHFEHFNTVKSIILKCLECKDAKELETVLEENIKIAWILKEEDRRLTTLGFRSNRDNPEEAYRNAGIEI